ncbi:transglutaminase-like domain-containing protein [uncultured Clostridium sp.]|uniref:transglutaminase domain-containing protein n=1 Tax=uncultured Clostridium sp. TaxID=59620 RepID=UPI0025F66030|nr:transglutaminase-like domain-containing protein [uncultured Clostridium sp.]
MIKNSFKIVSLLVIALSLNVQSVFGAGQDIGKVKEEIYNHLKNWDMQFDVPYCGADIIQVIRDSSAYDGYIRRSVKSLYVNGDGRTAHVSVNYRTTKDQESYVNNTLQNDMNMIINVNMSEFDKVRAIDKYIIDKYEYDTTLQSENSYSALTTGRTTCNGYAMTACKMFSMAGVENKIVLGSLQGVPHAWNEVKINGKWYNIDVTNNDSLRCDRFFLKSDAALKAYGYAWEADQVVEPCTENYI